MKYVRIWDLPTRLFHWALAICCVGLFVTGKTGGGAMRWHFGFGYVVASLLLFRLAWGLLGGRWSRFSAFVYHPRASLAYVRGQAPAEHSIGHNPLGAQAVFAMLLVLLAQVGSGLFSEDRGEVFGPLSALLSQASVRLATGYHKDVGQRLLLILVLLHFGAIAWHHFSKKNKLVKPMFTGDKLLPGPVEPARDDAVSRTAAAIVLAASAGAVAWLVSLGAAPLP